MTCSDLDECESGNHDCHQNANCTNTIGSFNCSCIFGFTENGTFCLAPWILVLSSPYKGLNRALILDGKGKSRNIKFNFEGNTSARPSCSVVWQGMMFMYGGPFHNKQISVVEECKLKRVGTLEFRMDTGGCAQRNNAEIFICFNHNEYKTCRRSVDPLGSFTKLPESTYGHGEIRIAVTSGMREEGFIV